MAEIQLTVNGATPAGVQPTIQTGVAAAATDQYFIPADPRVLLRVSNGSGDATMTIVTAGTVDGLAIADRAVTIPANETRLIANLDPKVYGNEGRVELTFAAADANIVLEAIRL